MIERESNQQDRTKRRRALSWLSRATAITGADPETGFFSMARALRKSYAALRVGQIDPTLGTTATAEEKLVHRTIGLDALLEIERRTVER